jgi:hypothetical protein
MKTKMSTILVAFFCTVFPDRWQVRKRSALQRTVPEAAMSLRFSKSTLSIAKASPNDVVPFRKSQGPQS